MAGTGITILIIGSGFEGQRLEEDVGKTIKEKLEMSCVNIYLLLHGSLGCRASCAELPIQADEEAGRETLWSQQPLL